MSLRFNSIVLYPQALFLAIAAAFFIVLVYRRLRPAVFEGRGAALGAAGALGGAAVLGASLYALVGAVTGSAQPVLHGGVLQFGSFGGYWGVLGGALVFGHVAKRRGSPLGGNVVPAMLLAGAIGRMGCLFGGCCLGSPAYAVGGMHLSIQWPLYDIAGHLLVLGLGLAVERRSGQSEADSSWILLFLLGYGGVRFCIEFLRSSEQMWGVLTPGQWMAMLQIAYGVALFVYWRTLRCSIPPEQLVQVSLPPLGDGREVQ